MKEVSDFHERTDKYVAAAFAANPNAKHCCRKGCFACCSEPVYAGEAEVLHILESLTDKQTEALKPRLEKWLHRAFPLLRFDMPNAFKYRELNAVCPFLQDGLCSVYDRRPFACRTWFAWQNPADCELPNREFQKFADFMPGIAKYCGVLSVNSRFVTDHLGVLLVKYVLNRKVYSGSRIVKTTTDLSPEFKASVP